MPPFLSLLIVASAVLLALLLLRVLDRRVDLVEWQHLLELQPVRPSRFDPEMVAELPEPARRYFEQAIVPGTPLWTVAEIDMRGRFGLGDKSRPNYRPMRAREILAAPHGFVWRARLSGWAPLSGSDAGTPRRSWTRFRLFGVLPLLRLADDIDHARSAFGRCIAEALFWTPSALLPGPGVSWEGLADNRVRVTVAAGPFSQAVELSLDASGRPRSVWLMRWSNANPGKTYRLQPFGGTLSDFREVQGFSLPFRVEAGNLFGTDDYFAFFDAEVTNIRFPGTEPCVGPANSADPGESDVQ